MFPFYAIFIELNPVVFYILPLLYSTVFFVVERKLFKIKQIDSVDITVKTKIMGIGIGILCTIIYFQLSLCHWRIRRIDYYRFVTYILQDAGGFVFIAFLFNVTEASALINQGVNGSFPNGGVTWDGFTDDWTGASTLGTRRYPDLGIRGAFNLGNREFTRGDARANDEAILDEMMLEFPAEGKIYPTMIRMARRYNDPITEIRVYVSFQILTIAVVGLG